MMSTLYFLCKDDTLDPPSGACVCVCVCVFGRHFSLLPNYSWTQEEVPWDDQLGPDMPETEQNMAKWPRCEWVPIIGSLSSTFQPLSSPNREMQCASPYKWTIDRTLYFPRAMSSGVSLDLSSLHPFVHHQQRSLRGHTQGQQGQRDFRALVLQVELRKAGRCRDLLGGRLLLTLQKKAFWRLNSSQVLRRVCTAVLCMWPDGTGNRPPSLAARGHVEHGWCPSVLSRVVWTQSST